MRLHSYRGRHRAHRRLSVHRLPLTPLPQPTSWFRWIISSTSCMSWPQSDFTSSTRRFHSVAFVLLACSYVPPVSLSYSEERLVARLIETDEVHEDGAAGDVAAQVSDVLTDSGRLVHGAVQQCLDVRERRLQLLVVLVSTERGGLTRESESIITLQNCVVLSPKTSLQRRHSISRYLIM